MIFDIVNICVPYVKSSIHLFAVVKIEGSLLAVCCLYMLVQAISILYSLHFEKTSYSLILCISFAMSLVALPCFQINNQVIAYPYSLFYPLVYELISKNQDTAGHFFYHFVDCTSCCMFRLLVFCSPLNTHVCMFSVLKVHSFKVW